MCQPPPAAASSPSCCTRRRFLALTSRGVAACSLSPGLLSAATDRPLDAGPVVGYAADGISEKLIQHDVFVIRREGRLHACTAICPHKANLLLVDAANPTQIICSGHDSRFDLAGRPQGGPARRPLERFGISLNAAGHVIVDSAKTFRPPQWEDPGSFLKLP